MTLNAPVTPVDVPANRSAWRLFVAASLALLLSACASTPMPPHKPEASTTAPSTQTPSAPQPSAPSHANAPLSEIATASVSTPVVTPLSAPQDIWERIRRGLAMPDLDGELVRDREQWYASRPDYMQRMTERSSRYLFHIVEEIERRNLPMELALLPFIESAFNPQAVSGARAAGMWQFMPATGQSFDLKQNMFRDDRRDVLASTKAALDYLEQLHERFGDWHLALAAYNWGQGNVGKAITRNQRDGLSTAYTDLSMPMETRLYVPKLQAVENIIAQPQAYGVQLPAIGNHPFFDTIPIERDMDVALISSLADITESDFRSLNPSIKQPLVMAAGTPTILLPWDNAKVFEERLKTYSGPLASWTAWVAPVTMTAAQVAEKVGMSESELRSVNDIPPRMKIRAGSSLLVHRSGSRDRDVSEFLADNAQLSLAPEVTVRRSTVRVRKGDTMARIASRYGVSTASLASWNRLSPNAKLKTGQSLSVMSTVRVADASPRKTGAKTRHAESRKAAARQTKSAGKASTRTRSASKKSERKTSTAQSRKGPRASVKVVSASRSSKKTSRN